MRASEFKGFYNMAAEKGINEVTHMGYMWINCTERQLNKMVDLAIKQGMEVKEDGFIKLDNGIRIKKL